jgi:hypothetical protein
MIGTELYEPEQGILQNGKTIAVKKLCDVHLDDNQFDNEVTYRGEAQEYNTTPWLLC